LRPDSIRAAGVAGEPLRWLAALPQWIGQHAKLLQQAESILHHPVLSAGSPLSPAQAM
jgi:hypothetical protein